jgi:hypothetical protein
VPPLLYGFSLLRKQVLNRISERLRIFEVKFIALGVGGRLFNFHGEEGISLLVIIFHSLRVNGEPAIGSCFSFHSRTEDRGSSFL